MPHRFLCFRFGRSLRHDFAVGHQLAKLILAVATMQPRNLLQVTGEQISGFLPLTIAAIR